MSSYALRLTPGVRYASDTLEWKIELNNQGAGLSRLHVARRAL